MKGSTGLRVNLYCKGQLAVCKSREEGKREARKACGRKNIRTGDKEGEGGKEED